MAEITFLFLTVFFFGVALAYVYACERLQ